MTATTVGRWSDPVQMESALGALSTDLTALADDVRPSVVRVVSGGQSVGAGAVVHERGLVLTNAHVIGSRAVQVQDSVGRAYQASLLRQDRRLDLAALVIDADDLAPLPLGDSRSLTNGAWVFAFGHPYGVVGAMTAGVVIGTGTDLPGAAGDGREWLAIGLRLRPGNSGGPVVDAAGRLVGLNAMMAGPRVGLAIPSRVIKRFLRQAVH